MFETTCRPIESRQSLLTLNVAKVIFCNESFPPPLSSNAPNFHCGLFSFHNTPSNFIGSKIPFIIGAHAVWRKYENIVKCEVNRVWTD